MNENRYRLSRVARIVRRGAEGDAHAEREGVGFYDHWDSDIANFDAFFAGVLKPFKSIGEYVASNYEKRKGQLIGVEFGGPARKLFQDLNVENIFSHSAGFVLRDHRSEAEKHQDIERHHEVVESDVFFKDGAHELSWRSVEKWFSEHGRPDLIIERMVQGIDLIRRPDLFAAIVSRWHAVLSDDGTMLVEVPKVFTAGQLAKLQQIFEQSPKFADSELKFDFGSTHKTMLIRRRKEVGTI